MKELSIEEKAKAYDEAIKRASKLRVQNPFDTVSQMMEHVFPELKESEDEKVRKEILEVAKTVVSCDGTLYGKKYNCREWIAWLEKQGEQKPVIEMKSAEESLGISSEEYNDIVNKCLYGESNSSDNVEPKFKVGDWVVDNCDYVWKIEGILNQFYLLEDVEGGESRPTIEWVNKTFHLWSIQDAKDGDVLCVKYGNDEMPFIFTGKQDDIAYCALNSFGEFVLSMVEWLLYTTVLPSTKSQRDTLFAKMKEAGYTFDFEKKELKKIEQRPIDECDEYSKMV